MRKFSTNTNIDGVIAKRELHGYSHSLLGKSNYLHTQIVLTVGIYKYTFNYICEYFM